MSDQIKEFPKQLFQSRGLETETFDFVCVNPLYGKGKYAIYCNKSSRKLIEMHIELISEYSSEEKLRLESHIESLQDALDYYKNKLKQCKK